MTNVARENSWTIPVAGEALAGKYVVEAECGRGGLSVVLSAVHTELDRRVAIKLLLPEWAGDADVVQRFLREGRAATRIRSEHVVRVFDVGTLDSGAPYLVLEYLEGHNLDDVLATWGPLPVATAIDWVLQAMEAIAEAHAYGIVHRDIKPANLFLTKRPDGSACIKVIDFGLSKVTDPRMTAASAKLTRPNDVMGSPHYMAPEQLRASHDVDARADVWALGAVLHELLSGAPPFGGDSVPQLCATVLTQPPPRLSSLRDGVPREVEQAVLRCLEKDLSARFADVGELARVLAPFGTDAAGASCARIERVLEAGGRPSEPTPLPSRPAAPADPLSWPSDHGLRPRAPAASAKIVSGALLILAGVGAGAFLGMYAMVHGGEHRPWTGVTAAQPTGARPAARLAPPATVDAPVPASPGASAAAGGVPKAAAPPSGAAAAAPIAAPTSVASAPATTAVQGQGAPAPQAAVTAPAAAPAPAATLAPPPASHPLGKTTPAAARPARPSPAGPLPSPAPHGGERRPGDSPPADDLFEGRK